GGAVLRAKRRGQVGRGPMMVLIGDVSSGFVGSRTGLRAVRHVQDTATRGPSGGANTSKTSAGDSASGAPRRPASPRTIAAWCYPRPMSVAAGCPLEAPDDRCDQSLQMVPAGRTFLTRVARGFHVSRNPRVVTECSHLDARAERAHRPGLIPIHR